MKVLFTAVGNSDPMTMFDNEALNVYDGAILQIVRYQHPEKVYLYLSKDILEKDKVDNPYEDAIKRVNSAIEVIKIERPDLVDVHLFDQFFDDFDDIIERIISENGEDTEILCNVSSGTPAMKSTLQILCALSRYKLIPVQVPDPLKGKHTRTAVFPQDYWDYCVDNKVVNDRTYVSENTQFFFKLQKEMIIKLIESYDYEAAYKIAETYKMRIPERTLLLLEFAKARSIFDIQTVLKIENKLKTKLIPYQQNDKMRLFEYALILNNKYRRNEMVEFLRALNPLLLNICKKLLKNKCHIEIEQYCKIKSNGTKELSRDLLDKTVEGREILNILESKMSKSFLDRILSEHYMILILEEKLSSVQLVGCLNRLNELRRNMRNVASHEMVCIKEGNFLKDLNRPISKYIADICTLLNSLGYDTLSHWDSYNKMNAYIINEIKH